MKKESLKFFCPRDGAVSRDDVAFLCNVCGEKEIKEKEGVFLCPQCFQEGENFQCLICDSKGVKVVVKGAQRRHL